VLETRIAFSFTGHWNSHVPQPMQSSSLTAGRSFPAPLTAPVGHTSLQIRHFFPSFQAMHN
jgi:hypothetical protein